MKPLLSTFPFVARTMTQLENQNKLLNKVTLTGKIVALHVAATLFEFTDKTAQTFNELQNELVEALLEENIKKVNSELRSKAQIAIDILIRNLFERTADVGFLATDSEIVEFLTSDKISYEAIQKRLNEYVAKYSVYNEIVVFDTQGNAKVNINTENQVVFSKDPILQEALQSDTYVERYAFTDIFKNQQKTLVYVQKIELNKVNIGVLVLCFKFEDELERILKNLGTEHESVAIADNDGLIASSDPKLKYIPSYANTPYQLLSGRNIGVTLKTTGYQGYTGIDSWYGLCIGSADKDVKSADEDEQEEYQDTNTLQISLNEKLNNIIEKADNLVEDLNDVIINGELIASKRKVYVLHPILDNLRNISFALLRIIKSSILNLENLVHLSLINDVTTAAHLAIDIMDRNLYERANDCRWWALTPLFREELLADEPDTNAMNATLEYINNLYTVYTNLFIYDTKGKIFAASHEKEIIGSRYDDPLLQKLLSNKNTQNYYVSNFETSNFYASRPTYIYNASISNKSKTVGGIGVVFDSEVEFQAMLKESFPKGKEGFALFVDQKKQIIASSSDIYKTLQTIELEDKFFDPKMKHAVYDYIHINEKKYIVASAVSKGYREYKNSDNYKNTLFAIVFIAI
jgi:hypothetical protein